MARIVLIETSTSLCSTALAIDGSIAEYRESTRPRAHASLTAPFVKEMLDARGLAMADCDAVCVSAGPGSYTGLRVGSSTAKGLCFASGSRPAGRCWPSARWRFSPGRRSRTGCCPKDADT